MFISAVWTLILAAPIHYRGSITEQVMQCFISTNLFCSRNIVWPEDEYIFSKLSFFEELFVLSIQMHFKAFIFPHAAVLYSQSEAERDRVDSCWSEWSRHRCYSAGSLEPCHSSRNSRESREVKICRADGSRCGNQLQRGGFFSKRSAVHRRSVFVVF